MTPALEAMGSGVAVAAFPVEGIDALIAPGWIAGSSTPEALAAVAAGILRQDRDGRRREAVSRSGRFTYPSAAARLSDAYRLFSKS